MKTGKSLTELAIELERQSEVKKDFIADTRSLEMTNEGNLVVQNAAEHKFEVSDLAHTQIAQRVDIPAKYYNPALSMCMIPVFCLSQ